MKIVFRDSTEPTRSLVESVPGKVSYRFGKLYDAEGTIIAELQVQGGTLSWVSNKARRLHTLDGFDSFTIVDGEV